MVALLGALLIFAAPSAHAYSVSNGKCADNTGLSVVVDFFDGREPVVKCVENWSGGTGLNGFQAAGSEVQGGGGALAFVGRITDLPEHDWCSTDHDGGSRGSGLNGFQAAAFKVQGVGGSLAFICRINDFPKDELCNTYPDDGYWSYWTATSGSWKYSDLGVTEQHVAAGQWQGFSYSSINSDQKNTLPRIPPTVPSAPKPKPNPSPKPTSTSKPKPTAKLSESSKPKPSSSGTSRPKPGSSSASTTSPSPSDSATSGAGAKDDSSPTPDGSTDGAESADPVAPEDSGVEAEDGRAPALPAEEAVEASERAQDSSAQHTRSENADSSPPVGTLIVGGVIVLLVGAGIFRHRTGKKLEGN